MSRRDSWRKISDKKALFILLKWGLLVHLLLVLASALIGGVTYLILWLSFDPLPEHTFLIVLGAMCISFALIPNLIDLAIAISEKKKRGRG